MRINSVTASQSVQATVGSDSLLSQVVYTAPSAAELEAPEDTHLVFVLAPVAASKHGPARPAMTFRIPRDYVWLEQAYDAQGHLCRVPLRIQLPGPTPWNDESVSHDNASGGGASPPDHQRHQYVVNLGAASGHVCRAKWLHTDNDAPMNQAGLLPQARQWGLDHHENLPHDMAQSLAIYHEPASSVHVSPPSVVHEDSVVFFASNLTGCKGHFGFDGRGASLQLQPAELAHWELIIHPIRSLIRSFVVRSL